ncbi:hypothetical protein BGX27_001533 [Mortierella sp. AM989]|nr:hypothetical protein BGX27_001533 [Mortierella sp. AM989]
MCFLCGKSLDGWTDKDDPYDEHLSHSRTCGWAIIKSIPVRDDDQLPFRWDDEDELPKGERMLNARLETFGDWWPHDQTPGWFGITKRMASAGFFYAPTDDSIDNVQCPYCCLGLDGWEAKDDPVHEHQRRKPTCPFFATRAAAPTKASAAKATKSKRKETGPTDARSTSEQSLLLTPKSQRVHAPLIDKPDMRKNSRVSRVAKTSASSSSSRALGEEAYAADVTHQPSKGGSKKSDNTSLPARSVEFDLPESDTTIREPAKKSKTRAAPGKKPSTVEAYVLRRRSQRIKLEDIEESIRTSESTQSTASEPSSKASSRSSSTAGRKRQQQHQESEDESASVTLSRQSSSSSMSVVVPKKRKLTKAEQALNRQNQINEVELHNDWDKENLSQDTIPLDVSIVSSTSGKPRVRKLQKVKDSDQFPQETDIPQMVTRGRGRPKKSLEEELFASAQKPKKTSVRALKRAPRSAEHLKSPAKKKSPKALIEIFELPDDLEPEQGQKELPSLQSGTKSEPEDTAPFPETPTAKDDVKNGMSSEAMEATTASIDDDSQKTRELLMTPPPASASAPSTPPPNSTKLTWPTARNQGSLPNSDDVELPDLPTTPVRRQAVSMQDIENAKVVVVDPTTPVRRAASSMDIEGWEDEDRRESTQSRLSSPFISPSKWILDGTSLTTSTPKIKNSPARPALSITPRQKTKDMVGGFRTPERHFHIDLMRSPHMKSPAARKTPRADILSPEKKQQQLVDRFDNLMQGHDSSKVLAVAESALKEEVKLLRRSQNKERKLAAAAAATALESDTRESSEAPEDEDVLMRELASEGNDNLFMQTPVKKQGISVAFESNAPFSPINNKTPLPISNVISAIGAASRRNLQVAASPFVKTPVKKTVNLLRLEDLETIDNATARSSTQEALFTSESLPDLKSVNPFGGQELHDLIPNRSAPEASKDYWERLRQSQSNRSMEPVESQPSMSNTGAPRLHEDSKENERRLRLMKESGLSERELKMTVEEFHRAILEEQVRQLELAGEAWIQRFQEESDRVRRALLDDGSL